MDTITVQPYGAEQAERWDAFVTEHSANGTFLQTRRFLSYHPETRFRDASLMLYRNQELVAVCPAADCAENGGRAFRSHPGSTFGGLVVAPSQLRAPKLVELTAALNQHLLGEGYAQAELRMTPDVFCRQPDEALQYALYHEGYTEDMEIACVIPLHQPYEALHAAYSYNKRYDLKRAEKHGLTAAPLTAESELAEFYQLLCLNLLKFDTKPVHTFAELLDFQQARLKDEISFIGVREPSGALVAGGCLFYFAPTHVLHTQYLATDTRITAYAPSTYLYDAIVREGLNRRCAALSLGTCTYEHGRVLNTGLILNKEGYGAGHSLNRTFRRAFTA